jgi:hypothetical protein
MDAMSQDGDSYTPASQGYAERRCSFEAAQPILVSRELLRQDQRSLAANGMCHA